MLASSIFRAGYAAIFLHFARRTVRKVQPFPTDGRRYCAFLPYSKFSVMAGSADDMQQLMPLVKELTEMGLVVEMYDRKKCLAMRFNSSFHTSWQDWCPYNREKEKVSIFNLTAKHQESTQRNAQLERACARHGQTVKTTTF